MARNVQITEDLFLKLYKYFLLNIRDTDIEIEIETALKTKGENMIKHIEYTNKLRDKKR